MAGTLGEAAWRPRRWARSAASWTAFAGLLAALGGGAAMLAPAVRRLAARPGFRLTAAGTAVMAAGCIIWHLVGDDDKEEES